MSDQPDLGFTADQINEQAQGNVTAFILSTIAYHKQRELSVADWITFVGRAFAPGWESMRDQGARELARLAAFNHVSAGGRLVSLEGDQDRAECVVIWPSREMLDFAGVTRQDAHAIHDIFHPIAEYLGMRYEWRQEGDAVRFTFSR